MKLKEKLMVFAKQIKSYFVNDQVRVFVLFLDDFLPSEKIFGLFGFTFFNRIKNSSNQRKQKKFFWISVAIIAAFLPLLVVNFVLNIGVPGKFAEATETFIWISGYNMVLVINYFFCYWNRERIIKIVNRLDQCFPHSSREQLQFQVKRHHHYLKILFRIVFITHVWLWLHFTYMPVLQYLSIHEIELLHPLWFPFDPLQPVLYFILSIIQSWIIFVLILMDIGTNSLYCSLVSATSMELDVLAQKISQMNSETDVNEERKLGEIIDGYNELIDIANELEEILSPILFVYVFSSIFQSCVSVFFSFSPIRFYLMVKYAIIVPILLINLFILCFYGEQLQISSMRVADEAYNCNWYEKNLKFRKMILLTMLRAQNPIKLTGMKFMNVGLPVYYWCLQKTHSYYSVLSGLYEA